MRIALFSDTFPPEINGVASSTGILRDELARHGHQVYVVTTRAGTGKAEWDADGTILRLAGVELKSLYGYVMTSPFHINAFNEIKKLNLDVIHAQTEYGIGIFARICSKQLNIPLVSTYHTTYEDYTHYVNFINSKTVDNVAKKAVAHLSKIYGDSSVEVIAPSEKTREMLLGYHVRSEIHVVPTGLELYKFSPTPSSPQKRHEIRSSYGIADEDPLVIYVGRIAAEKSLDLVIDGFARAQQEGVGAKLLIVGGGPDEAALQEKSNALGLSGTVIFAGRKLPDEVPDYYRAADAFISASLTETQGMTFIEAMACGLPIFARPDEVLKDLVDDGSTGYYFREPQDLPARLREFIQLDQTHRRQQSAACIAKIHPYSSEVFYERVLAVYQEAIDHYQHMYLIDDVRVKDDFVQLFITSQASEEELRVLVSLDDYCSSGLRKGGRLNRQQIDDLQQKEESVKAYQGCLRRIAVKDRTRKEIYDWLTQNTECSIETINRIVERLEAKGYINDERYCEESIAAMKLALQGEDRIIKNLRKKGLPYELIAEKLAAGADDEEENGLSYARKIQGGIRDVSVRMKKRMIKTKMIQQGYSSEISDSILNELDFSQDEAKELDNLRRCAGKAKHRYEKKYDSSKLRNTVYRYCAAQGYDIEDIYAILDEMEWKDDKD